MGHKVWKVANPLSDQALQLATVLGVSPLLGQLLLNRGITEPETAAAFLKPELSQLHDPFLLPGMERAISRIQQAIRFKNRCSFMAIMMWTGLPPWHCLSG